MWLPAFFMQHISKELADKLVDIACQQFKASLDFKQTRMDQILKIEEFYYGRKVKVPKGRFYVPLPTMSKFVDGVMSKIDDPPLIKYGYTDIADLKLAKKATAAWEKDSHPTRGGWPQKDRWEKKLACFSGRGISKIFAESDPKYKHYLEVVDYMDFHCQPDGGGDLEQHLFCGQEAVFRTSDQLKNEIYNQAQVSKLETAVGEGEYKDNTEHYKKKLERFRLIGLKPAEMQYMGQAIFSLVEWGMEYEGTRYYLLFDYRTGIWVRAHILKDVFSSNLWPWESWATHEDAFVFWSKAFCDDILPIADSIDTLFSQVLENRNKKNYGQRAYDSNIFPDPSELEWKPNGLARATPKPGQAISQGIYEFNVGEISGTVDLVYFMNSFSTNITRDTQGVPEKDEKVGIRFANLQEMADLLGLPNKSYRECWERKGMKYAWGLFDHLNEKMLVKIIGEEGEEWDELTQGETKKIPEFDIDVVGGSAELLASEEKMNRWEKALALLLKREDLTALMNAQWLVQEILKLGGKEEADIRMALSKDSGNLEILSEASQAIQLILKGKEPKMNRGANTAFLQKIVDFAVDKDVEFSVYKNLMAYAQAHIQIAMRNMARNAIQVLASKGISVGEIKTPQLNLSERTTMEEPIIGTPGKPVSIGQKASNIFRGRSSQEV